MSQAVNTNSSPVIPKVLILIKSMDIGGHAGGAEVFGINLACALKSNGQQVDLIGLLAYGTQAENHSLKTLQGCGVRASFLWEVPRKAQTQSRYIPPIYQTIKKLFDYTKNNHIKIVHSSSQACNPLAIGLKQRKGSPLVMRTAHISREWGENISAGLLRTFFSGIIYPCFMEAEVAVSKDLQARLNQRLVARLLKKSCHYIPNGINPTKLLLGQEALVPVSEADQGDLRLVSIGALTPRKGHSILIEAMPELLAVYPQASLEIVGSGESQDDLEYLVEQKGLSHAVRLLGVRTDLENIFRGASLFILPSLREGLPTVLMESMAWGIPVIASDLPGVRELINPEKTGWLFPAGDSTALAAAMIGALRDSSSRERVRQNALKFVNPYSMENIAQEYTSLYDELLQKNHKE